MKAELLDLIAEYITLLTLRALSYPGAPVSDREKELYEKITVDA